MLLQILLFGLPYHHLVARFAELLVDVGKLLIHQRTGELPFAHAPQEFIIRDYHATLVARGLGFGASKGCFDACELFSQLL